MKAVSSGHVVQGQTTTLVRILVINGRIVIFQWNDNETGVILEKCDGVLYGQKLTDPDLTRIGLNLVRRFHAFTRMVTFRCAIVVMHCLLSSDEFLSSHRKLERRCCAA